MNAEPPELSHDADLLALIASAVHDHPPGLHPIELLTAGRQGFSTEQGRAVLDDERLLVALTHQWETRPPHASLFRLAQSGDSRGEVHLRLLQRTGHLVAMRQRSQYGLAASTSGQGPEILVDGDVSGHGTVVTRQVFHDAGLLDIVIESDVDAVGTFPVVALYAVSEDGPPASRLLFLLTPSPAERECASHAESRLQVDAAMTSDRLSLFPVPVSAHELPPDLMRLVTHSVAVSKLPWKEAWRQAALTTPDGHPLRAAVGSGLSASS